MSLCLGWLQFPFLYVEEKLGNSRGSQATEKLTCDWSDLINCCYGERFEKAIAFKVSSSKTCTPHAIGDVGVKRRRGRFAGQIQGADVCKCQKHDCKAFAKTNRGKERNVAELLKWMEAKVEGRGMYAVERLIGEWVNMKR